jgi:hypothetical protein
MKYIIDILFYSIRKLKEMPKQVKATKSKVFNIKNKKNIAKKGYNFLLVTI